MSNSEKSKPKYGFFKVAKFVLFCVTVAIVFSLAFGGIMIRKNPDYIPTILGHTYLNVLSNSMSPEFNTRDLVIGKKIKSPSDIKVGDIITFRDQKMLVTHRVHEIKDGKFITKGDANDVTDSNLVPFENIVSKHTLMIPKAGIIVAKFQDFGFLAMLWCIFMYYIVKELIVEIKKIKEKKNQEKLEMNA